MGRNIITWADTAFVIWDWANLRVGVGSCYDNWPEKVCTITGIKLGYGPYGYGRRCIVEVERPDDKYGKATSWTYAADLNPPHSDIKGYVNDTPHIWLDRSRGRYFRWMVDDNV